MNEFKGGPIRYTRWWTAGVFVAAMGGMAFAQDTTVVVSVANPNGWAVTPEVFQGRAGLEEGPDTPPRGTGSAGFTVNRTGQVYFGTLDLAGVPLASLTRLSYWTYHLVESPGAENLAVSLQFDVDYDSTDSNINPQGRLVFEPLNNSDQDVAQKGVWQEWDARAGVWWMSGTPMVGGVLGTITSPRTAPSTFDDILAQYPNATIRPFVGAVILKAGGPWNPGFEGNADLLTVGIDGVNTAFDFEVVEVVVVDTDGDGVPDDVDECPNSDLSPTVVVGDCDSGVQNLLFENGCTLADYIAMLQAQAVDPDAFIADLVAFLDELALMGSLSADQVAAIEGCVVPPPDEEPEPEPSTCDGKHHGWKCKHQHQCKDKHWQNGHGRAEKMRHYGHTKRHGGRDNHHRGRGHQKSRGRCN